MKKQIHTITCGVGVPKLSEFPPVDMPHWKYTFQNISLKLKTCRTERIHRNTMPKEASVKVLTLLKSKKEPGWKYKRWHYKEEQKAPGKNLQRIIVKEV